MIHVLLVRLHHSSSWLFLAITGFSCCTSFLGVVGLFLLSQIHPIFMFIHATVLLKLSMFTESIEKVTICVQKHVQCLGKINSCQHKHLILSELIHKDFPNVVI